MRKRINYHSDLLQNNPTETGIKRECSLNKLQFYHITDNVTPDVMHDILEGVGGYETKLVLNSLIEQKLLTLDQLNNRLTSFDYWFSDSHNKPSVFKPQDLKNPDGAMRQTAAQMWCLLRLLPLMIGDLIPEESNVDSERATQMTEWLKNDTWPASQVEQYMKETAIQRAKWIRDNGSKTIMEIVKEYPRPLNTPGMILQDFLILNPDCASKLAENWVSVFKDKILQFASKEKQALDLLHNIEMMSAERQSDVAVQFLPVVLPTYVYKIGRKMFRPTFLETRKAFIDIQPIGTNMAEYLRSKESIEFPYILMLGDNQCFQAFTIINGAALEQSTLLAALDVCFKAFYIFDINYPKQCSPVWQFLQTVVYGLPGEETPAVRVLQAFIFANKL
ncbi:uncharacterized protein LOC107707121 [Sinocyclocheilus rhinocerous]|uniref:uncharacterized protein LOC107707121 n=1 Tax=Sinocyclocheilus rhinocerous TaxID=307959 RepID=UPI0007BAA30B|nr:PREDICTED: uncharacterized protein LOC107707121 [Sinocyclocheilus rhinocerous]